MRSIRVIRNGQSSTLPTVSLLGSCKNMQGNSCLHPHHSLALSKPLESAKYFKYRDRPPVLVQMWNYLSILQKRLFGDVIRIWSRTSQQLPHHIKET